MKKNGEILISSNGFDYLEYYLQQIYGQRGEAKYNLFRYLHSEEFAAGCRIVTNIDDIPEISVDDIKGILKREETFKNYSRELQERYDELNNAGKLTDDAYYELAGIMGLCPGQTDWIDNLFVHVLDLFVNSEEEEALLIEKSKAKPNIVAVMVDMMMNAIREGQIIEYKGHDIMAQGYARNYFRGENAYNKTTKASMFRRYPSNKNDAEFYQLIADMKMYEFVSWLNKLQCVRNWPYGDVFHGAIAQHYGIPTNGIDVTSDFKIALFFACCRYDNQENKWKPLVKSDFEYADSRENVYKRGGDSRYGVLFCAPADIAELSRVAPEAGIHFTNVTPIGYQPFLRCPYQSGYMIEAGHSYDMFQDISFAKVKFRHTEELCKWIFEEMDEGRKVYPIEDMADCESVTYKINNSKKFSKKAFQLSMKRSKINLSREEELVQRLNKEGYVLLDEIEWTSEDMMRRMDEAWIKTDYAEQMGISPSVKIGFCM